MTVVPLFRGFGCCLFAVMVSGGFIGFLPSLLSFLLVCSALVEEGQFLSGSFLVGNIAGVVVIS